MALDIVVCSLEPWDEVWRRNQYLVDRVLCERPDSRVLFVEPPRDTWRRGFDGGSRWRTDAPEPLGQTGRVWRVAPVKPLPRILGPFADLILRRQVLRAVNQLEFARPTIWLNDLNWMPLIESTGWASLYDITDDWVVESTVPERVRRRRIEFERRALDRCEEVVVCSPALKARKGAARPVRLVPNGVDLELMTSPRLRPDDLPAGPTAVYVGTLHEERLDIRLLIDLAAAGDAAVVLVGPNALREANTCSLRSAGVHLLGSRPHHMVPAYLQHADVVVVPHLVNEFTESLDPIKAYECLAVGTPTVSTPVAGFRDLQGPVVVANSAGFTSAVSMALEAAFKRRSALPLEATWEARGRRFVEALSSAATPGGRASKTPA